MTSCNLLNLNHFCFRHSVQEDHDNILRARASGKGVLTSPFNLLKSNHLGVVLTFAVYNADLPPNPTPEERIEATVGLVACFNMLQVVICFFQLQKEPIIKETSL